MKISKMITDKYKLRIPPTVYYDLLADVVEIEEQEPTTKNDLGVDCIDRQIISDYVESHIQEINAGYGDLNRHTNSILRMIVDYIENMPSVTPQEPKTGHWKPYLKEGLRYQCSACDSRFDTPWEYCPHCGAKMAETEDQNGQTSN